MGPVRNGEFAYLFELWIHEWRKNHPISPELENATKLFFESIRDNEKCDKKVDNAIVRNAKPLAALARRIEAANASISEQQ